MIDTKRLYDQWLEKKRIEDNKKHKADGWFYASSAGLCMKKAIAQAMDIEGKLPDPDSIRLFRLGTLLHKDIKKALTETIIDETIEFEIEKEFVSHKYNIKGKADLSFYRTDDNTLEIQDIKSSNDYKYQVLVGKQKRRGEKAVNYELQVATYVLMALEEKTYTYIPEMILTWYNKNNSHMRLQALDEIWLAQAESYWNDLNDLANEYDDWNDIPRKDIGSPIYKWECNPKYCPYAAICK